MLTQEQANDLNLQLHKQEAAEIGLDKINQDLDKYTDMIRRVADMMKTATPEQKERIRSIAPRLLEEYNNLKLKKSTYEDSYREATSKINEYNTLNTQQPTQTTNQVKRRVVNQNGADAYINWVNAMMGWWETIISPDKRGIITPNWQVYMWVWIEQTYPYTYWVNAMMNNTNKNVLTSPYTNWVNATFNKNYTPVSEATLPWWISTANWPRYVSNKYQSSVSDATLPWWVSTVNWPRYMRT